MFTDPLLFLAVAIITALALIGLLGCLIGACIHYGIGEEEDDGAAEPVVIALDDWRTTVRRWEHDHPEGAA